MVCTTKHHSRDLNPSVHTSPLAGRDKAKLPPQVPPAFEALIRPRVLSMTYRSTMFNDEADGDLAFLNLAGANDVRI